MNVKSETLNHYYEQINQVVNYIDSHLSEKLDLENLAQQSNYSAFHFHRIISAYLGEPLGSYIVRRRLEAAVSLLCFSEIPIGEIAFKVGYENQASFNRAFKRRFGISPGEYKKGEHVFLKNNESKIKFNAMENLQMLKPEIRTIKTKQVVFARAFGDYNKSAEKAWKDICNFAVKEDFFTAEKEYIGISYDDPKVTDSEKLRYDACLVVNKPFSSKGEIGVQNIEGGKYAVFTHVGGYHLLHKSYEYIFGKWLFKSEVELRDVPCFEKYLNDCKETAENDLRTEIYIPFH